MKRIIVCICLAVVLLGCSSNDSLKPAMALRQKLSGGNGCSFIAEITADYTDALYAFSVQCKFDAVGNMTFTVLQPETIAGIEGTVRGKDGAITFDDKVLAFDTLADGHITPIGAPWVVFNSLTKGYLTSCAEEGETVRITVNDSYESDALEVDIWLDVARQPSHAEILYNGRRYLTVDVKEFHIL